VSKPLPIELPFNFDFGVEVFEKSGETHPRRIGGFVTTDKLDKQGERLLQEGLNFQPFLEDGWFNDNHSKDTAAIVGYPDSAELMEKGGKRGWWVEGYLLEGQSRADQIWETAKALQKSGRRLGFSVEGKIVERGGENGEVVARADIKNVAITNCPVNNDTAMQVLAKSLTAANMQLEKALSMGAPGAAQPGVALTGAAGGGQVLAPESLEGAQPSKPKKKRKKRMKKSEGVAFLMERYGLKAHLAERVYDLAASRRSA
jgi:phage head maturation protease